MGPLLRLGWSNFSLAFGSKVAESGTGGTEVPEINALLGKFTPGPTFYGLATLVRW